MVYDTSRYETKNALKTKKCHPNNISYLFSWAAPTVGKFLTRWRCHDLDHLYPKILTDRYVMLRGIRIVRI